MCLPWSATGSRNEKRPGPGSLLICKRSLPAEISELWARLLVWEGERSLGSPAGSHRCKWWGTQLMFWQGKDNDGSPFPYQCSRLVCTWISLCQIMGTQRTRHPKMSCLCLITTRDPLNQNSGMAPLCYVTAVQLLGLVCVFSWRCWELMCQVELCD